MTALLLIFGLAFLIMGAEMLVRGASKIACGFGISPLIIGLTVVAAGTSMPEVVTSIIAAVRGERDIAVGNVVGSNIFNIFGILLLVPKLLGTHGGSSASHSFLYSLQISLNGS